MSTFHVSGVDLSMTHTGVAVLRVGDGDSERILLEPVLSKPVATGDDAPSDSYPPMLGRLRKVAATIIRHTRTGRQPDDVCIVVMEGPSLGSGKQGQQHRHTGAGLWWLVYHLLSKEAAVVIVPPKTLKSYVAKNGNADKVRMMAHAVTMAFPGIDFRGDDNLVDAYGLAAMAARELGYPVEPSPQRVNPGALAGVRWPAFMEQNRSTIR